MDSENTVNTINSVNVNVNEFANGLTNIDVTRVVSSVPEVYQHNSLHLVRAAADHLGLDKDRDVQAAISSKTQQEGEGEERE